MKPATSVRLDHVHVGVSDRRRAAAWYRHVLRLRVTYDYAAHGDPHGPLVLSGAGNDTQVALFVDAGAGKRSRGHIGTLAFRVPGADFLSFLRRLTRLELRSVEGQPVRSSDVVDHGNSYSVYIAAPDRNPLEITTYDHDAVKRAMKG